MAPTPDSLEREGRPRRTGLAWVVDVRPGEGRLLVWSFVCFFFLLFGYYILRPIRSEFGISGGFEKLPGLVITTLLVMLAVNPVFSLLVTRVSPRRLVPWVFYFLVANLLVFFVLLKILGKDSSELGSAFFVWLSVVNLFMVSVFWALMVDVFHREQSKRMFGVIAAGGSLGGIGGGVVVVLFIDLWGRANLFLVAAGFFLAVAVSVRQLTRWAPAPTPPAPAPGSGGLGSALQGIRLTLTSGYLQRICVYILLFTISSSFAYFLLNRQLSVDVPDTNERTKIFSILEMSTNGLTLLLQALVTGPVLVHWGVRVALIVLPTLYFMGLGTIGFVPVLGVLLAFEVLRRGFNLSVAKTAREVLYTVLDVNQKYKAKSFIDTFVYRAGDMIAAVVVLQMVKGDAPGLAYVLVPLPLAVIWFLVGSHLGREQAQYRDPREDGADPPAPSEGS